MALLLWNLRFCALDKVSGIAYRINITQLFHSVVFEGHVNEANNPKSTLEPEHRSITHSLRERIRSGQWPAGTMIPGRRELAREFHVSTATLERAILPLLTDGSLRADNRRGTFVGSAAPSARTPESAREPGHVDAGHPSAPLRSGPVGVIATF